LIKNRLGPFYHKTFAASNPSFGLSYQSDKHEGQTYCIDDIYLKSNISMYFRLSCCLLCSSMRKDIVSQVSQFMSLFVCEIDYLNTMTSNLKDDMMTLNMTLDLVDTQLQRRNITYYLETVSV
jgi:hypothetical protein